MRRTSRRTSRSRTRPFRSPSTSRLRRSRAALLPGGSVRVRGEREGRGTPGDQRAELRPLQDLRYQGPDPEHRLGRARGRRRTELLRHVTVRHREQESSHGFVDPRRPSSGTIRSGSRASSRADERAVRDAAQAFAQERLLPKVQEAFRHERTDPAIFREHGRARPARRRRSRRPTAAQGSTTSATDCRARDRAGRFRLPLDDERPVVAGDGPDLRVRERGDEAEIPAQARDRRIDRLLRPDRARLRLRSRRNDHARPQGRGRLSPLGRENVDHQQPDRRRLRRLGEGRRRRHPRLRAREGLEGPLRPRRSTARWA